MARFPQAASRSAWLGGIQAAILRAVSTSAPCLRHFRAFPFGPLLCRAIRDSATPYNRLGTLRTRPDGGHCRPTQGARRAPPPDREPWPTLCRHRARLTHRRTFPRHLLRLDSLPLLRPRCCASLVGRRSIGLLQLELRTPQHRLCGDAAPRRFIQSAPKHLTIRRVRHTADHPSANLSDRRTLAKSSRSRQSSPRTNGRGRGVPESIRIRRSRIRLVTALATAAAEATEAGHRPEASREDGRGIRLRNGKQRDVITTTDSSVEEGGRSGVITYREFIAIHAD